MDHLKAVGKAIKNSPRAIRKKFVHSDQHHHLEDDWYHSEDPVNAGVTFFVKYLGCTSVTKTHGTGSTDEAVKTIVQDAKARGGKLQKVQITVSSKFVRLIDVQLQMKLDELPLYRCCALGVDINLSRKYRVMITGELPLIKELYAAERLFCGVSYCTVDPYYDKVFCYISRNSETKGLECHAFLCSKKSKAEAITLTVAQAFNIAFERWQASKKQRAAQNQKTSSAAASNREAAASKAPATANGTSGAARKTTPPTQVAPPTTNDAVPVLAPPPSNSKRVTPSPPPPSTIQTNDPPLNIDVTAPANPPPPAVYHVPVLRRQSRDDSVVNTGLLEVKPTIAKAVSLDYLQLEDNFDLEFTRLAEARSNPRLPIGDHIRSSKVGEDVVGFMQGETSSRDVTQTRSVDDLLDL